MRPRTGLVFNDPRPLSCINLITFAIISCLDFVRNRPLIHTHHLVLPRPFPNPDFASGTCLENSPKTKYWLLSTVITNTLPFGHPTSEDNIVSTLLFSIPTCVESTLFLRCRSSRGWLPFQSTKKFCFLSLSLNWSISYIRVESSWKNLLSSLTLISWI